MMRLLEVVDADVTSVWSGPDRSRIHHLESGSGSAVVLLHGGTGGGANWFRIIGPLARSFRVLAPDLPGFGLSDPRRATVPLSRLAADRLMEWMEIQEISNALVVGTSFGGLAALRLAQRSPAVTRLMLLASAGLGRHIHPSVRLVTAVPVTALATLPSRRGTAWTVRHLLTSDRSGIPTDHLDRLIDYLYAAARAAGARYTARTLRMFAGAWGQREVLGRDELMSLTQPVSLVWGELDRLIPVAHARAAAAWIPHAALHVLPGIGHSPNWESPDAVLDAIVRLAQRPAGRLPDRSTH